MSQSKELNEDIDLLTVLKTLCLSYEEISVMKMQRIRATVLNTRNFYDKLSDVYFNVKHSYKEKVSELMAKKKIKDPGKLLSYVKNDKSVCVLLSANTKLHGSIVNEVFEEFESYISNQETDLIIVGKLGRDLYKQLEPPSGGKQYLYFEIPDMDTNLEDIKQIVYHLLQYEKITVFYGQYHTMMQQVPGSSNITGDAPPEKSAKKTNRSRFLFEPSLETTLAFFETQIFSSLFKQTVHESQLARFASRIKAMEAALERIEEQQTTLYNKRKRTVKRLENRNQLERLSGMSLWR